MRVNIYAEEMTDRVEIISKTIEGHEFTALRFYLELPTTLPKGVYLASPDEKAIRDAESAKQIETIENPESPVPHINVKGPFIHRPGDDDSAAVTFWGKQDLRVLLRKALAMLDEHDIKRAAEKARAAEKESLTPSNSSEPVPSKVESFGEALFPTYDEYATPIPKAR